MTPAEILASISTVLLAIVAGVFKLRQKAKEASAAKDLSITAGINERERDSWIRLERRLDEQDKTIVELLQENKHYREEIDGLYLRVYKMSEDTTTCRNLFNAMQSRYEILEERHKTATEDKRIFFEELKNCRAREHMTQMELNRAKYVISYIARHMDSIPEDILMMMKDIPEQLPPE